MSSIKMNSVPLSEYSTPSQNHETSVGVHMYINLINSGCQWMGRVSDMVGGCMGRVDWYVVGQWVQ